MTNKLKHAVQIIGLILVMLFILVETKPKFAPFFADKGTKAFQSKNIYQSLVYLKIASWLDPSDTEVHYTLGEAFYLFRNFNSAIKENKKNLKLNPQFYKSRISLAKIYSELKQYSSAIIELEKTLEGNPSDRKIQEILESVQYSYTAELINNALEAYQNNDRETARKLLESAAKVRSAYMHNLFELENIHPKKPAIDKLINDLEKILRLDQERQAVYQLLGDMYLEHGEYKKARDTYREYLSREPNNANIRYNLGVAYNRLKAYANAINEFRIALSLLPDNPDIIYCLAVTYKDQQMFEESERLLQYLLKSGYDMPYVYLNLAEIYAEIGNIYAANLKIEETIKLCEEKLSQNSSDIIYRITLDKALLLKNKFENIS